MPEPEPADGFEFGVTPYNGMDRDTPRLPQQFASMVDDQEEQVLLQVRGGAIGVWTVEVLLDRSGVMYLASGWKRFCCYHQIRAGHFLVLKYDGQYTLTVTVFEETMCRRHYTHAALANATNDSSDDDE
jgi:hypothetical protein